MKLSEYARQQGISYTTAHRWFKEGKIPHRCEQTPTGTIFVYPDVSFGSESGVHLYARVSSHDQKEDLQRQIQRLRDYSAKLGLSVLSETTEIASGMNSNRPKLLKLLSNSKADKILVEHRDRLTRFGFELVQNTLTATGREIIVINEVEEDMDLDQDFIDVITSMCARIYGQRSAKNRINRIKEVINDSNE